ncbi:MAG: protein-export chaperone SecB [Methylophilaceae bacterium]|nr:MAG: protein-export chaperone SecB [Methylophilaceae bacterium]
MANKETLAEQTTENQALEQNQAPGFGIEKLYVKDLSLELPNAPQIFTERDAPQIGIEISNSASKIDEGIYEVILTITVTSKIAEKTAFLIEVAQAGIFQVRNVPEENLEIIFSITCPNILFPYAREVVSDLSVRAGFPPVVLSPINFEALYAQQKQQQAQDEASKTTH